MEVLFFFIFVLLVGGFIVDVLGPPLIAGIGQLITFIALVFCEAIRGIFIAMGWILAQSGKGVAWAAPRAGRAAWLGLVFLFMLADEWRRGARPDENEEESTGAGYAEEEAPARDEYEDALARFGLAPGFAQTDLNRAYKRAIRAAHPDVGGSLALAQSVNAARDLIARRHGWK